MRSLSLLAALLIAALSLATLCGCQVKSDRPNCSGGQCPSGQCPERACNDEACKSNACRRQTCACKTCPNGACSPNRRRVNHAEPIPYRTVGFSEVPTMNLPWSARQQNWGGGSCVHASTVMCLRWQGLDELAAWWRRTYAGGEHASGLSSKLERAGVRFAYTTSGDVEFLEWACRTRRGCGITYFPNHFICLVHLDQQQAMLLDNNRIDRYLTVPRDEFLRRWQSYGGWACTPVYSPAPPTATR
jgi:hypothetical protein